MEVTDPGLMRHAMLNGVRDRATSDAFDFDAELRAILAPLGLKPEDSGGTITTDKRDPLMRSQVRLGAASALGLVQQSVVAAHIWKLRTGLGQDISIDLGQAIRRLAPATELKWETINGLPPAIADKSIGAYLGFFPARDGRHVIPANIYPDIKSRMLSALGCADNPRALGAAIARYTADELEQMGEAGGFVMGKVRSVEEFVTEPVFEYLASRPLIEITKIAGSSPEPFPEFGTAPLSGIRALGMGHVIAGAGIGRSLASLGADVLNLWRAMEWEHEALLITANVGMRSARVNVRSRAGRERVYGLLRDADVFFANRRPGLLDDLGLDAETAAAIRPGLIHVSVSTHGIDGPWRNRVGFDQVAGAVTGMVAAEGNLENPQLPPTSIVNDYLVAWLGATGAMAALARRAAEGGSYQVHVSLDRAAMWIISLGMFAKDYVPSVAGTSGQHELIDPQLFTSLTPLGIYQGVTENITLSRTPHHYANVLSPQGADQALWLPKPEALEARNVLAVLTGRGGPGENRG